jgi:hypothetical protein
MKPVITSGLVGIITSPPTISEISCNRSRRRVARVCPPRRDPGSAACRTGEGKADALNGLTAGCRARSR